MFGLWYLIKRYLLLGCDAHLAVQQRHEHLICALLQPRRVVRERGVNTKIGFQLSYLGNGIFRRSEVRMKRHAHCPWSLKLRNFS